MPGDNEKNNGLVGQIGGAIAGGASSLLGQLVGYHFNKKLAEQMNAWNLEQWNRENAYNTPKAQMARFREAGLNPNLIVGQQNPSAQSPQLTSGSPMDMGGFPDAVRQGALLESQINLNNANARKALGQNDLYGSMISLNASKEELNRLYGEKVAEEIINLGETRQQIIAYTNKLVSEKKLTDLKSIEQSIDNLWAAKEHKAQVELLEAECKKFNADAKEVLTLLFAKLANIKSDTYLKGKQASEANNMAAVLYNAYSQGQIDLQFIKDHPELHAFGNGAKEVLPSINAFTELLGTILPFGAPTKRLVNVVR